MGDGQAMGEVLTSGWGVLAVAAAVTSTLLLVRRPVTLEKSLSDPMSRGLPGGLRATVRGRPDAPPVGRRLLLSVAATGSLALAAVGLGVPYAAVLAALPVLVAALVVGLGHLEPAASRARRRRLVLETPQALELLAACLAAGLPARTASRAVAAAFDGPVGEDLGRVVAIVDLGLSDVEAWRSIREHPQLGPAAADLARSVESGTRLDETLRHHAATARELRRQALQVLARGVGVRSVLPMMICFIPSFLLLGIVPTLVSAISRALS
jgi:pilus assembly protein TadC